MPNKFKTHIRTSLANSHLQVALDNNYERRRDGRLAAYSSLPEDVQLMRQRAHAVRAEVISHLDEYLEKFIRNAAANGFIIHPAADAAEAVQIVLDIARSNNARLIAKAKSMVSEEIHLNEGLEQAGIRAIETDLGEYIVQLRGEHPAHIITPAVHLQRADVGKLFNEKLGIPYTEDVSVMCRAARQELRQVFLQADIGLSGVNFGVAESGTLALVTNEGNGRMVVTLPPIHIALMGVERLVPSLDDLALMLYLLPRWATGQKLSSYVSLVNGPETPVLTGGEITQGPRQRHIILLDNGRRAVSKSDLAEALYCIRCGACLNMCPVFRELGGHAYVGIHGQGSTYSGPIGSVISPALFGQSEFGHLARASSLCGACKEACPVDIDLPKLLLRIRAGINPSQQVDNRQTSSQPRYSPNAPGYLAWGLRAFNWMAISPWRFAFAQRMAGFFSRLVAPKTPWLHLPAITGWGYSKDFPRPASRPFRDHWAQRKSAAPESPAPALSRQSVVEQPGSKPAESAPSQVDLVEQFARELSALGGTVRTCQSSELGKCILDFLQKGDFRRIQAWDGAQLPKGLLDELRAAGIQVDTDHDPAIPVGLTGVDAAIAESGTLLLTGAPDRPLTASLVPEIHLAVLHASTIHADLPEVLNLPEIQQSKAAVLISGPSRTADIEMTLSMGMHGPREVHAFCLNDR